MYEIELSLEPVELSLEFELSQMLTIDSRTFTWNSNIEAEVGKKKWNLTAHFSRSRFMSFRSKLNFLHHWVMHHPSKGYYMLIHSFN